jgi:hypothetical protein
MFLYGLTLQRSAAINCVAYGNFSGPKLHEIVVAHGKSIELLRPDAAGKVTRMREERASCLPHPDGHTGAHARAAAPALCAHCSCPALRCTPALSLER